MEHIIGTALHVGISVRDMEESIEWYQTNIGFFVVNDEYIPSLHTRIVFLEKDGFQLELFQHDNPKPLPADEQMPNSALQTIGTKHLAFSTQDMAALKRSFKGNNVKIVHERLKGTDQVMFIQDCNGILIEFIQSTQV